MDERTGLKRKVDAYLNTLAPDVFFEKRSPGRYDRSGVADYVGCAWGLFFAIEIKHPIKKPPPSKEQQKYLQHVSDARGFWIVAYSVEDVRRFMGLLHCYAHR